MLEKSVLLQVPEVSPGEQCTVLASHVLLKRGQFTPAGLKLAKQLFILLDTDGDGNLNAAERAVFAQLASSTLELDAPLAGPKAESKLVVVSAAGGGGSSTLALATGAEGGGSSARVAVSGDSTGSSCAAAAAALEAGIEAGIEARLESHLLAFDGFLDVYRDEPGRDLARDVFKTGLNFPANIIDRTEESVVSTTDVDGTDQFFGYNSSLDSQSWQPVWALYDMGMIEKHAPPNDEEVGHGRDKAVQGSTFFLFQAWAAALHSRALHRWLPRAPRLRHLSSSSSTLTS